MFRSLEKMYKASPSYDVTKYTPGITIVRHMIQCHLELGDVEAVKNMGNEVKSLSRFYFKEL